MRCIPFLLFLFYSIQSFTQINFYARSDARQIVSGEYFTVSFVLENARGANFKAPSFVDFDVVGGPNTSTEMTFLNGQSKQKVSYSYTLTSNKIGKYTLGPASIRVNNQTLTTDPLTVEVLKRKDNTGENGTTSAEFIVEAVLDFDTAYVGQQITLKYELLTTKDVRSASFRRLPEFDGFFAQEIQNYGERTERVVRDGVQYVKKVLKVIALFPQQQGRFTIEPAQIMLGISDGRRSNSFFFNTRLKKFNVQSNSKDLVIAGTPGDAPISFSGAIGDFYLGTSVDKKSITLDDALTLTLQIRGFGDSKFIEAPQQPYTDLFDIYDPNLLQEKVEVVRDKIQVTKTYEYLMIPKKKGLIKFNPELSYYDVDSNKYVTIYAQQYRVNVLEGSDRELSDVEKSITQLSRPDPITDLSSNNGSFFFSNTHLAANGILLLGMFGLLIVRRYKDKKDNIDPATKRKMKAKKIAISKLSSAKHFLDKGDVSEFYIQLRKTLVEYLSDQINLPSSQFSKVQLQQLLEENGLHSFVADIIAIMSKGEQAIYASISPGNESVDYERSLRLIEEMEVALT